MSPLRRMSSDTSNPSLAAQRARYKHLVCRFYADIWNKFDLTPVAEILSNGLVFRGSLGHPTDLEGFKKYVLEIQASFPDFHQRVDELYVDDAQHTCIAKMFWSATHSRPFRAIEPTNRRFFYPGVGIFRFENDRIIEVWAMGDTIGMWDVIRQDGKEKITESAWEGRTKGGLEKLSEKAFL
jgi:predicted ester cyclase